MNQPTDVTGATCSNTKPHGLHPVFGDTLVGSCPGIRPAVAAEQWIADQVSQLSENDLVLVKTVLDEISAGLPVEHFAPGTKVYVHSYGTAEFIVQGTAPWFDENGVAHRKVEVKSATGGLSGHIHPSELRRVPPSSPSSACTCPLGPEDAHFPECPWHLVK